MGPTHFPGVLHQPDSDTSPAKRAIYWLGVKTQRFLSCDAHLMDLSACVWASRISSSPRRRTGRLRSHELRETRKSLTIGEDFGTINLRKDVK